MEVDYIMKRAFTFLCALVLLATCFSGVFVQAATMNATGAEAAFAVPAQDEAVDTEPVEAEVAGELAELEPIACDEEEITPISVENSRALPYENSLGKAFLEYLQPYIARCDVEIPVSQFNIHYTNFAAVTDIIYYEAPELFSVKQLGGSYNTGTGMITVLKVLQYQTYSDTPAEYAECLTGIRNAAEYLLRGVRGNNALNDVEKALVLHDRLAVWTEYDLDFSTKAIYSAVGPLANQSGVCQGYALAYMYLLDKVGIESDLCRSSALDHAWNIVYINGTPYYTDVTWDDPVNNYPASATFKDDLGRVYHKNFLRSYEGIRSTGHDSYDYQVVSAGTAYDSGCFWMNTSASIELIGGDLYYLDNLNENAGKIWRYNDAGFHCVYQTSPYQYNKLSSVNGMLLLSRVKDVVIIDPANPAAYYTVFAPSTAQNSGGYIEGMKFEKNKIWTQVYYYGSYYQTMTYIDPSTAVKITQQPKNVVVANGATAKLTVKATGDGLSYAWFYAKKFATTFTQSGNQTSNVLSLKMSSGWDGARFYCVITDMYGNSVTTDTVQLIMGNVATIKTQPKTAVAPNGKTAKITLKASGDGLKYTWYYAKKGATKYTKSGNQTTNVLSIKMSAGWHGAQFYCVVTDKYGNSVKTNAVKMYMGNPAAIKTQPKSTAVVSGKTAKITVKASGDGLKYTWYYAKKGATKYTKSGNQTTNVLSLKMSSSWNGAKFYCVVTDKYGTSVKTSTVTLSLAKVAKITTQPVNTVSPKNKTVKVSVKATGDGLKYQWYYAKKGSSKYKKTNVTSATYSVKMTSSVNGRKVYCVVTDKYGNSVKTKAVTLSLVDTKKVVAKSWKGTYEYISDGRKYSISKLSIKITSAGKVTIKVPKAGEGYNKGTFTYKLKYVKCVGDAVHYRFTNSTETLTVVYSTSSKLLNIYLSDDYRLVFKKK